MRLIEKLAYCLFAIIPVVAAGCSASGTTTMTAATSGAPPEQPTIVVEAVPTSDEAGLYIAEDDGFFRQQGLNVKIEPTTGGELTLPDLQSGKAQIVAGNYVSFIKFQANHRADLRIFAEGSLMNPGNQAIYVRPGSDIHSVADLAAHHATIGVNTLNNVGQVLIGSLLKSDGLPLGHVHLTAPKTGFPGLIAELKSGSIDAAWLPEPFGTMAQQQFGAVELADLDQGALQSFPIGCYIGTKSWTTTHPSTVAAFLRALEQGQEVADSNRAAVEQSLEKHTQVPPVIADSMTVNNYPLSMSVPAMQRVADAMYEFGVLSRPYAITNMVQPEPGMVRTGM